LFSRRFVEGIIALNASFSPLIVNIFAIRARVATDLRSLLPAPKHMPNRSLAGKTRFKNAGFPILKGIIQEAYTDEAG
jgi:hypothetical protein